MPELPEVETVRRVLASHLEGKTIENVQIFNGSVIAAPRSELFSALVKGQKIVNFSRRGKFLRFTFESGDSLVVHLRMTGCLTVEPPAAPAAKHMHLAFALSDGNELRYEDTRRFGKFWYEVSGEADNSGISKLGIEPIDQALTAQFLREKCCKSKRSVKSMLLDQSMIAGIGNIYADEILFAAKIRPDKPCNTLTAENLECLAAAIPERIRFFIDKNTMTFTEYISSRGREYRDTPYLQVYGRAGKLCPVCGERLQRTVLLGRSSYFCPQCQKS